MKQTIKQSAMMNLLERMQYLQDTDDLQNGLVLTGEDAENILNLLKSTKQLNEKVVNYADLDMKLLLSVGQSIDKILQP